MKLRPLLIQIDFRYFEGIDTKYLSPLDVKTS
jgi:hypothetical protein